MKFKRDAARWKKEMKDLENSLLELVKANAASDDPKVKNSFTFKKMQEIYEAEEDGQQRWGLETTEATMQSFVLAMILFPSIQKKAQAEIDRVIGPRRLPTFKDQSDLPYLHAVILETLRWNPVLSNGLPHVSRKDDVYDGYFIPKGTSVIANAWGFSRNPKYYSNPSVFDPDRYLKQTPELDPREFVFGYGRRICPGKDLAFQNVWILAASLLWASDLVGAEDKLASLPDVDRFSFGLVK
ncbi:hypothetical protein FRC01_002765 [Tulasnella sp. 417]|nr:hypothetical protein FRC01_002765 [Tulasnella sp. 417]